MGEERDKCTRNWSEWTRGSGTNPANDDGAPTLRQIQVSCYVTAANRATPVFEVFPQRNCVRVVNRSIGNVCGGGGTMKEKTLNEDALTCSSDAIPPAEWTFGSVFSSTSPSHAVDFFTEITLPALRTARDGINSNIVVWGVHPTQKFRLLFGKSVSGGGFCPQPEMPVNDVIELYGQLIGMLHAFFTRLDVRAEHAREQREVEPWRLGISSWIIVDNQAIDLLETTVDGSQSSASEKPISAVQARLPRSFVSLEASSLAAAFHIVQTAKTNRIVRKQNAESVHFFVRLTLFHDGQVSTVHLVDLVDQKDCALIQEQYELYELLRDLRPTLLSPIQSKDQATVATEAKGKMVLSNFMLPLLTTNAQTFLYVNVIDSRASLRESVQILEAVANLQGFACVCKPLCGVPYEQLCFRVDPNEHRQIDFSCQMRQVTSVSPFAPVLGSYQVAATTHPFNPSTSLDQQLSLEQVSASAMLQSSEHSEAMSWLDAFTQRKQEILGGSIDSILPATAPTLNADILPFGNDLECDDNYTIPEAQSLVTDLYERLRESLQEVNEIGSNTLTSPRPTYGSAHSVPSEHSEIASISPLPIVGKGINNDSVQTGKSRSAVGSNTRTPRQRLQHQDSEDASSWSQLDHIATGRLEDCSSPKRCEDISVRSTSSSLKSDLVEPTDSSSSPMTSYSPPPSGLALKVDNSTLEAFKKAGVPTCVIKPPKLDGLDTKTAEKVHAADATLLRKNYDALLSIVREQQEAKELAEARAVEAQHDQAEQKAMFEVQIENMKLTNVGLRSKIRALESRSSLPQVFEQYEQELQSLQAQVQELQTRNVALELRTSGSDGAWNGPAMDFKKKYQQAIEDNGRLEREVMEYQRRERHHQVHNRLAGESTRRAGRLSRDLNSKNEDLVAAKLSKQRLSAEMDQALGKVDELHHRNQELLREKAATTEELVATRMYLASLENEKKKALILDRFVEKHGDRMNKLRQRGQFSSTVKVESWSRDQYARECEDKLLASIKRSLPQAVPLCNKLLRRLEMQELSLREFSEREVDFINLLVELVSDQPTVSLKHMIEQEMTKLHLS